MSAPSYYHAQPTESLTVARIESQRSQAVERRQLTPAILSTFSAVQRHVWPPCDVLSVAITARYKLRPRFATACTHSSQNFVTKSRRNPLLLPPLSLFSSWLTPSLTTMPPWFDSPSRVLSFWVVAGACHRRLRSHRSSQHHRRCTPLWWVCRARMHVTASTCPD